jgi:hypothetical protein
VESTVYLRRLSLFTLMPLVQFGLGLWLLASPYFLQFTLHSEPRMNVGLVAPMVILFALMRLAVGPKWFWVQWVNALFGIWLAVSPFAFGLGHINSLMLNFVIVGLALIVTSVLASFEPYETRTTA